jgi:hypothetical protein
MTLPSVQVIACTKNQNTHRKAIIYRRDLGEHSHIAFVVSTAQACSVEYFYWNIPLKQAGWVVLSVVEWAGGGRAVRNRRGLAR